MHYQPSTTMARPATITLSELAPLLRSRAPVSATDLAGALGVNRTTIIRTLPGFGDELVTMGATRSTRYFLRREIRGTGNRWPVYRVDAAGRASEWMRLEALHDRSWRAVWAGNQPEWADHFSNRDGLWSGFPFFLSDSRPRGFLGRAIARHVSRFLGVPDDPQPWSDEDILVYHLSKGWDLPGDQIVGESAMLRAMAEIQNSSGGSADRYPELAAQASSGLPGTSAGGEQPKFLTHINTPDHENRAVLVKFSPPLDQQTGRRWADLLLAEAHALEVLAGAGLANPGVRVIDAANRRFLEIPRFDRTPTGGRRGVVSLEALHSAAVGSHTRGWTAAIEDLHQAGLVDDHTRHVTARLQAFGELIGNTDMHSGNLSFWLDDRLPFRVTPAYDMLPMLWAPGPSGELLERSFDPAPSRPVPSDVRRDATSWATAFWNGLAADNRLSAGFARVAREAADVVGRVG